MLKILPEVPEEMLLWEEQRHTQRQQLPTLQKAEKRYAFLPLCWLNYKIAIYSSWVLFCFVFLNRVHPTDLGQGVVVRRPAIGLLDQLAVHLVLQLRVGQTHLQSILGQRCVVINGRGLDQNVDKKLTGLQRWNKVT